MKRLFSEKGLGVLEVLVAAGILVFVIMPVFAAVMERYILFSKAQVIKDAVDITNAAAYNSIIAQALSREEISFDTPEASRIYNRLLSENLSLNPDLTPKASSPAEGRVEVRELVFYSSGFPQSCSYGVQIERPAVHSCVMVPVKPGFYRHIILGAMGKQHVELMIHVDSEIPINN
jgi:hypothetical protein